MNEMVRMVVVPMIEREGQEAVAMTGMDHVVVAVIDTGVVALHVMMVVEVIGTGPGHMIDQVGVGAHHLLMFAIDECRLLTVNLQLFFLTLLFATLGLIVEQCSGFWFC